MSDGEKSEKSQESDKGEESDKAEESDKGQESDKAEESDKGEEFEKDNNNKSPLNDLTSSCTSTTARDAPTQRFQSPSSHVWGRVYEEAKQEQKDWGT